MPVIGITGGIATGKSSFCALLKPCIPSSRALWFDSDSAVRQLTASDDAVRSQIRECFGDSFFTASGEVNREMLRGAVFSSKDQLDRLNAILHPRVRSIWTELAEKARESKLWLFAEIPLLYETGGSDLCDKVIVVACSYRTQIRRITGARGLTESTAQKIIAAQSSLEEKCRRADILVWNDAALASLERQTSLLAGWLNHHYA
jgi:dephospho-CoA kinase